MAGYSAQTILAPEVILETISRLELPGTTLQRILGWPIGGIGGANPTGNATEYPGRSGAYDIFDVTRRVATGRVPGTASSRQAPHSVGTVNFTIPRSAERITLADEKIHNQRPIGGPVSGFDRGGQRYIEKQEEYLAQRFANLVEFQSAALLRGSYTFDQNGDDLEHRFSGGEITINFRIPDDNKDQLDLGTGSDCISADWSTGSTDIPSDLFKINAGFVQQTGMGLSHVICDSTIWNYVVNNTKVATQGGSANIVFETIRKQNAGEFSAVLRSIPWVTWHIVDYGLEIWNGSSYAWTKLLQANHAYFIPEPSSRWCEYILGGEYVTEGPNGVRAFRSGFYPYAWPEFDPSGWNLACVFNGLPSLPVPKAIANGTVVGF